MTGNLVEAAISGVVLALWGPAPIFLFNGIMYLFGSASALFVPESAGVASGAPEEARWRPWADLRHAVRYVLRERRRRYILLGQIGGLIFAPLFFMAPLVSSALDTGSQGYGFFQSLTLGGVSAGSLLASSIGTRWPKVKMWIGGQILYAIGFLALGIFVRPGVAFVAFVLFGLGCTGGRVHQSTLYQQILPSKHRGRVFGIGGFVGGALQPLALAVAMLLVDRSGAGVVLAGLAGLLLVLLVTQTYLLPMREKDWVVAASSERARASGSD
jgi:ENTS family enterobactin (siderophore) exporter